MPMMITRGIQTATKCESPRPIRALAPSHKGSKQKAYSATAEGVPETLFICKLLLQEENCNADEKCPVDDTKTLVGHYTVESLKDYIP